MAGTSYYTNSSWNTAMCPYKCDSSVAQLNENPMCLGSFALFIKNLGGLEIFIIIIIATVFLTCAVLYFLTYIHETKH